MRDDHEQLGAIIVLQHGLPTNVAAIRNRDLARECWRTSPQTTAAAAAMLTIRSTLQQNGQPAPTANTSREARQSLEVKSHRALSG